MEVQHNSANPYWDENEVELLPTVIVTAIALKSRCDDTTILFFTGFYEAFKFMMECKTTNDGRKQWAQKSLTNLDNTHPMLRNLVSPTKK